MFLEIGKTYVAKRAHGEFVFNERYTLVDWFAGLDVYLFEDGLGDLLELDATQAEDLMVEA